MFEPNGPYLYKMKAVAVQPEKAYKPFGALIPYNLRWDLTNINSCV